MTFDWKPDGSPVTRVDREVETELRETIEREHPESGVLGGRAEVRGEEDGLHRLAVSNHRLAGELAALL
jgi:fructose-1,6-bisphosphatase/inositol monophosphatase family enzyme